MQEMGIIYLNYLFWSCSTWNYHSYQFGCYTSIPKYSANWFWKKKKKVFQIRKKELHYLKNTRKKWSKLHYDNLECVFSAFDLLVEDTVKFSLWLSTDTKKINVSIPFNNPSFNWMNTALICFLGTK